MLTPEMMQAMMSQRIVRQDPPLDPDEGDGPDSPGETGSPGEMMPKMSRFAKFN